jgi:hypothetical protein
MEARKILDLFATNKQPRPLPHFIVRNLVTLFIHPLPDIHNNCLVFTLNEYEPHEYEP